MLERQQFHPKSNYTIAIYLSTYLSMIVAVICSILWLQFINSIQHHIEEEIKYSYDLIFSLFKVIGLFEESRYG